MRIYLVDWVNNYGLDCVVIVGNITPEQAKQKAIDEAGAWPDNICVQEITQEQINFFYPCNQS